MPRLSFVVADSYRLCRDDASTIAGRDKIMVAAEQRFVRIQRRNVVLGNKIGTILRKQLFGGLSDDLLTRSPKKLFTGSIDQGERQIRSVLRSIRPFLPQK